ncbi:MAG: E3 ubiquitin-protein ligase SspH1 [Pseudomonas sp.]|nr:MAG: E3 ubiquitin-protein ligase SspH1 [Pseudomonas sp.]
MPSTSEGTFTANLRGVHYDFLKDRIPAWFTQAAPHRQNELARHPLQLSAGYLNASAPDKAALAASHTLYREALNSTDHALGSLQDVQAFAEQPLKDAIKTRFGLDLDVRNVYFARKFGYKSRDDLFGVFIFDRTQNSDLNYVYRGVSLLEAALANFTPEEARESACSDCQVITRWSNYDADADVIATSSAVLSMALPIAPHAFAQLCRNLDLGAKYQQHLKAILLPEGVIARQTLHRQLQDQQRHQLALSVEIARLINSSIGAQDYRALHPWLKQQGSLTLYGKPATFAAMTLFGVELYGPLLIGPSRQHSDRIEPLLMYIPGDPEQPLKAFASSAEAMDDLRTRLYSASYRQFFSRFVPQRQQGVVFGQLRLLYQPGGDPQANYPPQARPVKLPVGEVAIDADLWPSQCEGYINKVLGDARAVAVPTGDEDRQARIDRLHSYLDAVVSVFNLAAFVVPGLGPVMLSVAAWQMFDEAFIGAEAFEQGDITQMWAHLASVALNVALLKTGAAVLPHIQLSSVVDNLQPVRLPDGQPRLWKPDLVPYAQLRDVPEGSQPDAQGLHQVGGEQWLPLDGQVYSVGRDATGYRIQHPTRPQAYQPRLMHNGRGAWTHEAEHPQGWSGPVLMRRLGHGVQAYSDVELEQARRVSDTSEEALRKLHVDAQVPPPMLTDTLTRLEASRWVDAFIANLGSTDPAISIKADAMAQLHVLTRYARWPHDISLRVVDAQERTLWQFHDPVFADGQGRQVTIDEQQLKRSLFESVLEVLDQVQTNRLLEQHSATPLGTLEARTQALRRQLAEVVRRHKVDVFNDCYDSWTASTDLRSRYIKNLFPSVPSADIDALLQDATVQEQAQMTRWDFTDKQQTKPIPLRLVEQLRWTQRETRMVRAREGLYLDALMNADSEALALRTLEWMPKWPGALRLEVREGTLNGPLRASVGPENALSRKVLVHEGPSRYQAFDQREQGLHSIADFYTALQHALPDAHRRALGVPDVNMGAQLKTRVCNQVLPFEVVRQTLNIQPARVDFKPPVRWADGRIGYPLSGWGNGVSHLNRRVLRLYPTWELSEVEAFLGELGGTGELRVRELEDQFDSLKQGLDQWLQAEHTWTARDGTVEPVTMRSKFIQRQKLLDCWQRRGLDRVYAGDEPLYRLDLRGFEVPELPVLPPDAFAHIDVLDMSDLRLNDVPDTFLRAFPSVLKVGLRNNNLQRLPGGLQDLLLLKDLRLARNRLMLTPDDILRLEDCQALRTLDLSQNPNLGLTDVTRLTGLVELGLRATDLHAMPEGLANLPGLVALDLRYNRITQLARVLQGPFEPPAAAARRVFQACDLDGNPLSATGLEQHAQAYMQLAQWGDIPGGERAPHMPPAPLASTGVRLERWMRDVPTRERSARTLQWDALNRESGGQGEGLFRLLEQLSDTYEYRNTNAHLGARVWSLLDAMAESEAVRSQMFELAGDAHTASEGATLLFSRLEVSRLSDAGSGFVDDESAGARLVKLAKGLFRLEEVDAVARRDASQRFETLARAPITFEAKATAARGISRSAIRIAYRVALKDTLGLPGQPDSAAPDARITPAVVEQARQAIRVLDDSPRQFAFITGCGFWRVFLKRKYAPLFDAACAPLFTQMEALNAARPAMTPEAYQARHDALTQEIENVEEAHFRTLTLQELAL